ncbi:MAG TPA: MBL fold metallo-hydrolase [Burkholderiales bacterium]|nr:MBL fold metallo-hydrolase [Burkholderiales bacterium]
MRLRAGLVAAALSACSTGALDPQRVATDVYAFLGAAEEIKPSNRGNVINTGFIIGYDGVIVVDSGANDQHGQRILDAIARTTSKPVLLLINTHPHPENVLGNSAFARFGIPILAHSETIAAMRARCEMCFDHTLSLLNEDIMRGTEIVIPGQSAEESQEIQVAGRRLKLIYFGWAHTEGDLAVLDVKSGVLFTGGLVSVGRTPVMQQARTQGWISALESLQDQPIERVVPDVGPISHPIRIADTLRYLKSLLQTLERQYEEGKSAIDVLQTSELPQFKDWALYDSAHPLNVQHVYRELEREELEE